MDLAFGRHGTLYVLEIDHDGLLAGSTEGALFALSRNGSRRRIDVPPGMLNMPGGIAVRKNRIYVTTNSGSPGGGRWCASGRVEPDCGQPGSATSSAARTASS